MGDQYLKGSEENGSCFPERSSEKGVSEKKEMLSYISFSIIAYQFSEKIEYLLNHQIPTADISGTG